MIHDVAIIGGGVVGCAIARELSRHDLDIVLLEKEADVAEGISKANSGVIHAGFNVRTGSLKARLNREALSFYPGLCEELDVPYKVIGKLVVARRKDELPYLERLLEQGRRNGCEGLSIIGPDAIRSLEPRVKGEFALYSANTAIVSPMEFTVALAEVAHRNGVAFLFGSPVVSASRTAEGFTLGTATGSCLEARIVVNAAGMYSDIVHAMVSPAVREIHPCRGEYFVLDKMEEPFLKAAVYPVPPADGRGLGIHVTPTTEGNIILGPSAEFTEGRADVATTKAVMEELKREATDLIPDLARIPVIKAYAGLRPKLFIAGEGSTFEDFIIEEAEGAPGFMSLIGIESPGLTAAPAIARYVVENLVASRMDLKPNLRFDGRRSVSEPLARMDGPKRKERWADDPDYGEVICRCNHVSRAELLAAIENPLGTRTLNAIKKRTHAMMGRCQGGFCLPRIVDVLVREYGLRPRDVIVNAAHSEVVIDHDD